MSHLTLLAITSGVMVTRPGALMAQTAQAGPVVSFPQTAVGTPGTPLTVTFTFQSSTSIATPVVLTQGAVGLDFTDAGGGSCTTAGSSVVYQAGQSCTVNVGFTPKAPGQRLGAVQLTTTSGALVGNALLNGIGTGPLLTFGARTPTTTITSIPSKNDVVLQGVATDGNGDVYFVDSVNGVIREVVASNGAVTSASPVIAVGSGLTDPAGIAIDGAGDIFVIDRNAVKEIVAVNGVLSATSQVLTLTGGYSQLLGIAVDALGNVYFTDSGNATVYEIAAMNGIVTASSPVSPIYSAPLATALYGIRVDAAGNIFVVASNDIGNLGGGGVPIELVAINGSVSPISTQLSVLNDFATFDVAIDAADDDYTAPYYNLATYIDSGNSFSMLDPIATITSTVPNVSNTSGIAYDGYGHLYTLLVAENQLVLVGNNLRTPPTVNFGTAAAGSSPYVPIYLQNAGNAPLTFAVPSSGNNPSVSTPFTLGTDPYLVLVGGLPTPPPCTVLTSSSTAATLAPGALCYDFVTFHASGTAGPVTGTIVHTDNDKGAVPLGTVTQTLQLVATVGNTISVIVNPVSVPSGSTSVTLTGTVTFGGPTPTGPVTFTVDGSPVGAGTCTTSSVTPGVETCTLNYNPSTLAVGTHTVLAVVGGDMNYLQTSSTIPNDLTVTQSAVATTTQTMTSFPDTPFGSMSGPVTVTFTFQTAGTMATPQVLTAGATGLDFADAGTGTCTTNGTAHAYAAGDICTVDVMFKPSAIGYRAGAVVLNAAGQIPTSLANLAGNGTGPMSLFVTNTTPTVVTPFTAASVGGPAIGAGTVAQQGGAAYGMVIDGRGDLLFSDAIDHTIKMIAATNGVIAPNTPITTLLSGFVSPAAMALDGAGNLYVVDSGTGVLEEFMASNGVLSSSSPVVVLEDDYPSISGVAVDSGGNVFFTASPADGVYSLLKLVAVNGVVAPNTLPTLIASGLGGPMPGFNIRVDGLGNLYVCDDNVVRFNATNGSVQPGATTYTYSPGDVIPLGAFTDVLVMPSTDVFIAGEGFFHYDSQLNAGAYSQALVSGGTYASVVSDGRGHLYAIAEPASADATSNPNPDVAPTYTASIQEFDFVTPPSLSFAPTQVGSTTAAETVSIQNEGNAELDFNDAANGNVGTTSSGFTQVSACYSYGGSPLPIDAGVGCNFAISFSPVAGQLGTLTGTYTVTGNSFNVTNATQTISLSGTATSASSPAPTLTVIANAGLGAAAGQPATLIANVTSSTTGTITGSVTFFDNGVAIANSTATLTSGGVSVTVAPLAVGTHPITAVFTPTGSIFAASTSAVALLTVQPLSATIYLNNSFYVYDGSPHGVTATTVPAGLSYTVTYEGSPTPPTTVGSYRVIAKITDPNYTGMARGTLTISQTPTSATITLGNLNVTYDGMGHLPTVATNPAGLTTLVSVGGLIYTNGLKGPYLAGYYPVTAEVTTPGYTGTATAEFIIAPAPATFTLSNLNQPYTGSPSYATVTAVPSGASYSVTYNGSSYAPIQPGTYTVVVTANSNYSGSATGTLTISNDVPATVTLSGSQFQQYTGSPLSLTTTTNPAGLSVAITYNGSPTPPTNAGFYTVVATITSPGYYGTATSSLDIFNAPATVTLGNLNQVYTGSPLAPSVTTSPPGLAVTLTYFVGSVGVPPPTDPGTYAVIATITDPNYQGSTSGTLTITPGSVAGAIFLAGSNGVGALNSNGSILNATTAGGGIGEAVDASGDVWSIDAAGASLAEFMPNGSLSTDYPNVGLTGATALAIDGNNNLWVANGNGMLAVLSTTGKAVSSATGSTTAGGSSVVIDNSGNVWVTNTAANSVDEVIGVAAPVAPLTNAVQSNTLGVKP